MQATLQARSAARSSKPLQAAPPALRLVALDWGLVETLLALGVQPAGVAEIDGYRDSVGTPAIATAVPDVGLRLAPSLELLQQLAPDLILINSSQESQRPMLERIAPVRAFAIYTDAGAPYRHAEEVTLQIGQLCGCESAARTLVANTARVLAQGRSYLGALRTHAPRIAQATARPLYLMRFFDMRHVGVYGQRSLFQDVMDALGVANAWTGPTDYWGIGVAGLEKLAAEPDADLFYFDPLPAGVARTLATNRLWQALPAVAAGRVTALPPFWGFGMLPSAARFANALLPALARQSGTI